MDASGVRRSWPTAASRAEPQLQSPGLRLGRRRLGVEPPGGEDGGQLSREGGQDLAVARAHGPARQGQHLAVGEGDHRRGLDRGQRWLGARRRPPSSSGPRPGRPSPRSRRTGCASTTVRRTAAEVTRKASISSPRRAGKGSPSGETIRPATRASIRASARARSAASVRRADDVDQHAHHPGSDEEHDQGDDVAGIGDGEGVDGRGEEPVGAAGSRPRGRAGPATRRPPRR